MLEQPENGRKVGQEELEELSTMVRCSTSDQQAGEGAAHPTLVEVAAHTGTPTQWHRVPPPHRASSRAVGMEVDDHPQVQKASS